jgi:hypothetical protein
MPSNAKEFQISITRELDIVKNRVRDLIGTAHWGEEGSYKEAVLRNVIKRFLPHNLTVGTGFIVAGEMAEGGEIEISNQIDIIIYDNSFPVLFSEGDFIITTQQNVRAIIEVKTRVINNDGSNNSLRATIEKFNNLMSFPLFRRKGHDRIFKGLFSFEYADDFRQARVEEILRLSDGMINHICLGKDVFVRHWINNIGLEPPVDCPHSFYNIYRIENLSFSYFISNLIHITTNKELDDRYWFSFPIVGTKEQHRRKTICLDS